MNPSESNISNAATTLRKTKFRIFGSGLSSNALSSYNFLARK